MARRVLTPKEKFSPAACFLPIFLKSGLGDCIKWLGVTKLHVTGGEPLVQRNILWLFERLGELGKTLAGIDAALEAGAHVPGNRNNSR